MTNARKAIHDGQIKDIRLVTSEGELYGMVEEGGHQKTIYEFTDGTSADYDECVALDNDGVPNPHVILPLTSSGLEDLPKDVWDEARRLSELDLSAPVSEEQRNLIASALANYKD